MAFFKRIEVWFLLVLSVGGIGWVLWSESADRDSAPKPAEAPAQNEAENRFHIASRRISRESDHLILTLEVARASGGDKEIILDESNARLLTDAGESVPTFFVPFDPPAVLGAGDNEAQARLRYWMPAAPMTGGLTLEIDGERLPVKLPGNAPGSDRFPEGVEVAIESPDWAAATR